MERNLFNHLALTLPPVVMLQLGLLAGPVLADGQLPGSSSNSNTSSGSTPVAGSTSDAAPTQAAGSEPNTSSAPAADTKANTTAAPAADSKANTTAAPAADSTGTTTGDQKTLKGQAVLNQATELKQLGIAARKVQKAANDLYGEATIQQVQMMYEPDVIGMGEVIMIPHPQFTGQYLPPRKKWVDQYITQLMGLLPLVKEEFTDVVKTFPDEAVEQEKPSFDDLSSLFVDVESRLTQLQQLQQANDYTNKPIADASYAMHDDMNRVLKDGKKLFRALKKYASKHR